MFNLPNPAEQILKQIQDSHRRLIESATQPIGDRMNNLFQPIKFKMPTYEIEMPRLEFEPPGFDFPDLAETIIKESTRGIKEAVDRFNPILAKASQVMAKQGWWLIRQLPLSYYSFVANQQNEVTREKITNYILDFFSQDEWEPLTKVVKGWNLDSFNNSKRHFQDALEVHKQGRYTMTAPGLVIQIERIVREFIQGTDGFTHNSFAPVRKHFQDKFKQLEAMPKGRKVKHKHVQLMENYHNLSVLERLYDTYYPAGQGAPDTVNRHAIAHGLWLGYDTVETSLYLFLLLDMLHAMMEQLKRHEERRRREGA
jgi:hypothetical protein